MNRRHEDGRVEIGWAFAAALMAAVALLPVLIPRAERFNPSVLPEPVAGARPGLAPRLVFILVDALGANAALAPGWMPRLQARLPGAAHGVALASFPTITPPGLRALLSGRAGLPEPTFLGGLAPAQEKDSILSRASAAGRKVFVFGQQDWPVLFKGHAQAIESVPYVGRPLDAEILRRAMEVARGRRGRWDILAIHLPDLDGIGHHDGIGSAAYCRKLIWIDEKVKELAAAAGQDAAVVFTADHGQSQDGSHGGMEMEARRVPFILWGPGVRPADLGTFSQRDAAPTLAALLGLPPPVMSEGLPLLEALRLPVREKAAVLLDLLEQRRRRWLAARTDWPWLKADPRGGLEQARRLWEAGDYERAAQSASDAVRAIDQVLSENSPDQWTGRLTWMLWLLVLASAAGAAWHKAGPGSRRLAAVLSAASVALLACPLLLHSFWPHAVAWGLAVCGALLALSLASGLGHPALSWLGWSAWVPVLAAAAFPSVVDVSIWSWSVLALLLALRLPGLDRDGWRPMGAAIAALLACALLSLWIPARDMSMARLWLPQFDMRRHGSPPWGAIELVVVLALAAAFFSRCREALEGRAWKTAAMALAPLAAALAFSRLAPALEDWSWLLCIVSLAAAWLSPLPRRTKAMWLSLLGLAFCRTQSSGSEACLLALATLAGWRWADLRPLGEDLWQGLGLGAFCLWAYLLPGGRLDFSHISVADAYASLGQTWNPHVLAVLVALKPAGFFITPALALLADLPALAWPGAAAAFGAFSVGNLTLLWFEKFYFKTPMSSLVDTSYYERLVWGAILAWVLLAAWSAGQAAKLKSRGSGLEI